MMDFVMRELRKYNEYRSQISSLESYLELVNDPVREKRRRILEAKIKMMDSWLLFLLPDEQFVVRRHLIDKHKMNEVALEQSEQWNNQRSCSVRSMQRYQAVALDKISDFVAKNKEEIFSVFSLGDD